FDRRHPSLTGGIMSRTAVAIGMAFLLAAASLPALADDSGDDGESADCAAVRCAAQPAIDAACPRASFGNHGQYVPWVPRALKHLGIPEDCRGDIPSCAANSICGKEGAVTCDPPRFGACNLMTQTCLQPPDAPCTSFRDCPLGSRCEV